MDPVDLADLSPELLVALRRLLAATRAGSAWVDVADRAFHGIPPRVLMRAIRAGELAGRVVAKDLVMVRVAELDRWIAARPSVAVRKVGAEKEEEGLLGAVAREQGKRIVKAG